MYRTIAILMVLAILIPAPAWAAAPAGPSAPTDYERPLLPLLPAKVYAGASPSVFQIIHEEFVWFQGAMRLGYTSGTGWLYGRDAAGKAWVITNQHVIDGTPQGRSYVLTRDWISAPYTHYVGCYPEPDGWAVGYPVEVVGSNVDLDIALLRVELPVELASLPIGDSDQLLAGDTVYTIGNSRSLFRTFAAGILSAVRSLPFLSIDGYLQTQSLVHPGNSGGPLLDVYGRVVGMARLGMSDAWGGYTGIGLSIPANTVVREVERMLGSVNRSLRYVNDRGIPPCRQPEPEPAGVYVPGVPYGPPAPPRSTPPHALH